MPGTCSRDVFVAEHIGGPALMWPHLPVDVALDELEASARALPGVSDLWLAAPRSRVRRSDETYVWTGDDERPAAAAAVPLRGVETASSKLERGEFAATLEFERELRDAEVAALRDLLELWRSGYHEARDDTSDDPQDRCYRHCRMEVLADAKVEWWIDRISVRATPRQQLDHFQDILAGIARLLPLRAVDFDASEAETDDEGNEWTHTVPRVDVIGPGMPNFWALLLSLAWVGAVFSGLIAPWGFHLGVAILVLAFRRYSQHWLEDRSPLAWTARVLAFLAVAGIVLEAVVGSGVVDASALGPKGTRWAWWVTALGLTIWSSVYAWLGGRIRRAYGSEARG